MRSRTRTPLILILFLLCALSACRRGAEPEDERPVAGPADPWAMPPDSLYGATAAENLRARRVELELRGVPRGWDGMRIAVISDLRIGAWADSERVAEAAARVAAAAEPDLVVLLGDLTAGGSADALGRALAPLRGTPMLAVLGPGETASEEAAERVSEVLGRIGATVLRNQAVAFARGTDTAFVAGIEAGYATFTAQQQAQLLAGLPEGAATPLLLTADASVLTRLPERRFAAVLAGRTLCAEVEVAGATRLAALGEGDLGAARMPRSTRLFRSAENTLFVSCSLGHTYLPARFASAPEVPVITLRRIPEPRAEGADADPAAAQTEAPPSSPEPQ
jgi:uncharacterized protein